MNFLQLLIFFTFSAEAIAQVPRFRQSPRATRGPHTPSVEVRAIINCLEQNETIIKQKLEDYSDDMIHSCELISHGITRNFFTDRRNSKSLVVCKNSQRESRFEYYSLFAKGKCELVHDTMYRDIEFKKYKKHKSKISAVKR